MVQFQVSIPNLPKLQEAMASYPTIALPIMQRAIVATQAILAKNTNASTVPIGPPPLGGGLVHNWGWDVGNLQARWYPKQSYAPFVNNGTAPHIIRAKNSRVLANKATGQVFGPVVHHPGTKANPFMSRILAASQADINDLFVQALEQITAAIAE
jgi:hypothetical protein